jgi:hypothetical protein
MEGWDYKKRESVKRVDIFKRYRLTHPMFFGLFRAETVQGDQRRIQQIPFIEN